MQQLWARRPPRSSAPCCKGLLLPHYIVPPAGAVSWMVAWRVTPSLSSTMLAQGALRITLRIGQLHDKTSRVLPVDLPQDISCDHSPGSQRGIGEQGREVFVIDGVQLCATDAGCCEGRELACVVEHRGGRRTHGSEMKWLQHQLFCGVGLKRRKQSARNARKAFPFLPSPKIVLLSLDQEEAHGTNEAEKLWRHRRGQRQTRRHGVWSGGRRLAHLTRRTVVPARVRRTSGRCV